MTKVDSPIKLESLILAVTGILLYHLSMTSFALTMIFLIAGIVELFDDFTSGEDTAFYSFFFVRILKLRGFDCVGVANDENDTYFLYQDQTRKKLYCFKQEPEEFGPYDKRYVGMIKNQAELLTFKKGKRILLPYFCRKGIGA